MCPILRFRVLFVFLEFLGFYSILIVLFFILIDIFKFLLRKKEW